MFDSLGLEGWTPLQASLVLGLVVGVLFGALAQRSRFCLRRGLVGPAGERAGALSTWLVALAAAVAGTAALVASGTIDFSEHRFHGSGVPVAAILIGGALFGAGMVLTRGCASRLTVLAASGNLRAVTALTVFAIAGYATIKGILAPARVWLSSLTLDFGGPATLGAVLGDASLAAGVVALALLAAAWHLGGRFKEFGYGIAIGALVPLAWFGTGYLLLDEFEPLSLEAIAFTQPFGDALFYTLAATAIEPSFGAALIAGTLVGSLLAALASGEFAVVGFDRSTPTGTYLAGGLMMGIGGVLAGGCTIGAGLSGVSTLSLSALLALTAIVGGALLANAVRDRRHGFSGSGLVPAE